MKISRLFLKVFCTKNPGSISEVTSKRFPGWMCGRIPEKNPSDNLEKNQEKLLKELWKQFRGKNAWDVFGEILGERNPSMNFWGMDGGCSEWIPRIPLHFFILKLIFQILSRNQRNASQVWIKLQVYFAFVFTFCHFFPEFSVQFSFFFKQIWMENYRLIFWNPSEIGRFRHSWLFFLGIFQDFLFGFLN